MRITVAALLLLAAAAAPVVAQHLHRNAIDFVAPTAAGRRWKPIGW